MRDTVASSTTAAGEAAAVVLEVTPEGFELSAAAIAAAECPQSRWADATDEGGRARREAQRSGDHDQPRREETRWIARGGRSATPARNPRPAVLETRHGTHKAADEAAALCVQ